ncbi:hypothetical protein, partial [Streptomyces sp. NPDC050600]|uniref:hypothetical protein n=1 Tax=Streptomyces sp. NPDC050600 TaxID=3157213 RepID=UPI00344AE154
MTDSSVPSGRAVTSLNSVRIDPTSTGLPDFFAFSTARLSGVSAASGCRPASLPSIALVYLPPSAFESWWSAPSLR